MLSGGIDFVFLGDRLRSSSEAQPYTSDSRSLLDCGHGTRYQAEVSRPTYDSWIHRDQGCREIQVQGSYMNYSPSVGFNLWEREPGRLLLSSAGDREGKSES